jgi:hypothetical protein
MAVQNPPVNGGFEPPVMSFSGVVLASYLIYTTGVARPAQQQVEA